MADLRSQIGAAHALLFCTPEYAGTLPGAFKDPLDWTVGWGEMDSKPVAWVNTAGSAAPSGGEDAHASLRKVLGYVGAQVVEPACARIPVARGMVGLDGIVRDDAVYGSVRATLVAFMGHLEARTR